MHSDIQPAIRAWVYILVAWIAVMLAWPLLSGCSDAPPTAAPLPQQAVRTTSAVHASLPAPAPYLLAWNYTNNASNIVFQIWFTSSLASKFAWVATVATNGYPISNTGLCGYFKVLASNTVTRQTAWAIK